MDAPERKDNTERRETAAETIARQKAELRECLRADQEKERERQRVRDEEERARQAQGELDLGLRRLNEETPAARRARLAAAYERPATKATASSSSSTSSSSTTTNNSVPPYERKTQPTAAGAPRNAQPRAQATSRQLPPNRVAARSSSSIGAPTPPPSNMRLMSLLYLSINQPDSCREWGAGKAGQREALWVPLTGHQQAAAAASAHC